MRCLIGQFQREEKKRTSLEKSGAGSDEIYISKWFAFKLLMFLKDKNKPRETIEAGIEKVHETEESDALTEHEIEEGDTETISAAAGSASISQKTAAVKKRSARVTILNKRSEEAYAVLKSLQQNLNKRDEYDAFGELVAAKIRKLDENTRDDVMLQINHLLVKAKQGHSQYQYQVPLSIIHMPQNQTSPFSPPDVHPNSSTSNSSHSGVGQPFSSTSIDQSMSSYIPNDSNSSLSNTVRNYFETFNDVNDFNE